MNQTNEEKHLLDTTRRCEKCGHDIPESNWAVHSAACGRAPHPQQHERVQHHEHHHPHDEPSRPEASATTTVRCEQEAHDDVELLEPAASSSNETHEQAITRSTDPTPPPVSTQWTCPRCTLRNPPGSRQCEACLYVQPQQQQPQQLQVQVQEISPAMMDAAGTATTVLSCSLLGGLVGGPVGVLAGGCAGAVMDGMTRFRNHRNQQQNNTGGPVFTTITTTPQGTTTTTTARTGGNGRLRMVTIQTPPQTSTRSGRGTVTLTRVSPDQMILQMLLINAMEQGAENVNQMTYEELLQRFGVGTEHRGASQETIDALPLQRLDEDLEDVTCNICLEDFKAGQEMRKLKCSHCFHKECIDQWLSRVASCPICKVEIQSARTTEQQQHEEEEESQRRDC